MVVNTDKTLNGKVLGYEVISNGYKLFQDGIVFISQPEPFANLFVANGSYEENALAHIENMINSSEQEETLQEKVTRLEEENTELNNTISLLIDDIIPTLFTLNGVE